MKLKKLIFVFCVFIFTIKTQAQLSKSYYDGDTLWQLSTIYAKAVNTWDDKTYDRHVTMYSVDLSFYKSNFTSGGLQQSIRLKIISDFIPQLASPLFEETRDQLLEKSGLPSLTSLLGWYNFGWAVISKDKFQFALGAHLGGYTHGIEVDTEDENNNIGDIYPYVAGGPAVFIDIALPLNLELHYEGSYAYAHMLDPDKEISDDEKPYFLNQTLQLRKNKWFVSAELVNGIVETGNAIQRSQIGIGYAF